MKTYTLQPDGTLTINEETSPGITRTWNIQRQSIAAHRRDATFDTEVKAGLSAADLAKLPA